MFSFFIENALESMWCAPNADLQSITQPARLTANGGVWNTFSLPWRIITLPEQGPVFHIYMVGQISPKLLGLLDAREQWISFSQACNTKKMIVDIYDINGVQYPRTQVWYMVTKDKDYIVAVKQQPTIPTHFDSPNLYIRLYTNAYFQTPAAEEVVSTVNVQGGTMVTTANIIALQNLYNASLLLPGTTYAFVNGMLTSSIDLISTQPGDVAEFVYDSSIYKTITFNISDLLSFTSTLDNKFKYLLHYAGEDNSEGIEYQGDIDFFLTMPSTSGRYTGLYYHKNQVDAVRMLTHKDYSIPVAYVVGYANSQPTWTNPNALVIRMNVRKSGYTRTLPFENNRIKELYKMTDSDVIAAMVGLNATVPNWQAPTLEASPYTEIMRSDLRNITLTMAQDAFGYNALSKLLGDTPSFVTPYSNKLIVNTPPGLINSSFAYEYDVNGVLLGYYNNTTGDTYTAVNSNTNLVEMIYGQGTQTLDEIYGIITQTIDPSLDYRMYVCPIDSGTPTYVWTDVTGSSKYVIINGQLTWLVDMTQNYTLVRSNKTFLAYDFNYTPVDGLIIFNLTSVQINKETSALGNMLIPMGELDIFLNGQSLIENLDYYVKFPRVVIVNKEFLINPTTQTQHVDVRFTGFCNTDLIRTLSTDSGYIDHELLSENTRYDIRDDQVIRIVVDGKVLDKTQVLFSEDNSGVSVPNAQNGRPYLIRQMIVPLLNTVPDDTYTLLAKSRVIDTNVSNYMTLKLPEPTFTTPNTIPALYRVYSPFVCKIIYDLINGVIDNPIIQQTYSTQDVLNICQPYEYLLDFDPTQSNLKPDPNYVIIEPHNLNIVIDVNLYIYKFVNMVIQLYMKDAFSLSQYLSITT